MAPTRRVGPEVSRIVFVRNLPYKVTGEELYKIFGRFGPIRQIRLGNGDRTRGTAFVVFAEILDAKQAFDSLTGFNVEGRFLTLMYFHGRKRGEADGEGGGGAVQQAIVR